MMILDWPNAITNRGREMGIAMTRSIMRTAHLIWVIVVPKIPKMTIGKNIAKSANASKFEGRRNKSISISFHNLIIEKKVLPNNAVYVKPKNMKLCTCPLFLFT